MKPTLKSDHLDARLELARSTLHWTKRWSKMYFTDEKKFNLDGTDGQNYFWSDLTKNNDKEYFSKDIHNKRSVIV